MNSPKYSINKQDLLKIARFGGVALFGAFLTYLSSVIPNINFGIWTPVITAVWGIILESGRRYVASSDGTSDVPLSTMGL